VQGAPKTELESAAPPNSSAAAKRFAHLQRVAWFRRWLAPLLLLAGSALVVAMDFARRSARLADLDRPHEGLYLASLVESILVWSVLLHAASRRQGRQRQVIAVLFVFLFKHEQPAPGVAAAVAAEPAVSAA